MESSSQTVSLLRQRMIEDMRMRKLMPKTREAYIRAVRKFTKFLDRSPDTATTWRAWAWLDGTLTIKGASIAQRS